MTIREYIERRANIARVVTVIWVLVVIVVALLVFPRVLAIFGTASMLVGLIPLFGLYYAIGRWTRCPRCRGSLSNTMTEVIFARAKVPDKCPHCGVSFDAPISSSGRG
jgi:hypothetical protein